VAARDRPCLGPARVRWAAGVAAGLRPAGTKPVRWRGVVSDLPYRDPPVQDTAMPKSRREPVAPVDAAWLRMEDPTNLMMITGVLMFAQPLDPARFRDVLSSRLIGRFARFRMRAVVPSVGAPYWEDDPHFSLDAHIHRIALPAPGDRVALEELVSDLMSAPLDFSKPPWQFHIVEGYGAGSALIARLHHAIGDGVALVHVLLSLTDEQADPMPPVPELDGGSAETAGVLGPALRALEAARSVGERLLGEGRALLDQPERLHELGRRGGDGVAALGKLLLMPPDPPTLLKGPLGVQKRAVWSEPIALDLVKAIGRATGATINDVLLAAVSGALRSYLVARGADVDGLTIRAVVPVNLRPLDRPPTLGNQFGVVFLPLPVGVPDPYDRLVELRERMDRIKGSPEALVAFGILTAFGISPEALQEIGVGMFGTKATAVMTNVPGPRETIYMAGAAASGMLFWVPQSGHLGMGVSILSYAGMVLIGVAVDCDLIPEPERIVAAFDAELALLRELVR
jgi:diacylglycerol O-acyltransferase / wax synthase